MYRFYRTKAIAVCVCAVVSGAVLSGVFFGCERGGQAVKQEEKMFEQILGRVRKENERNVKANLDEAVEAALGQFAPGGAPGAFIDIDYKDISRTEWRPLAHLSRLRDFSMAYTAKKSRYYKNETLYAALEAGLRYWHETAPVCDNWWYNQIAAPQHLGQLLIQMRAGKKQLPPELETALLEQMRDTGGSPADWTGANKTDIALHWFYRACLARDTALMEQAAAFAWETITTENPEGIQKDNSYFQHDEQLYILGYGMEFIKGISMFAMYLADTPWALSGDKLALFSQFVTGTYLPVIRGQYALFDVGGRGLLSRKGTTFCGGQTTYMERMSVIDKAQAPVYKEAIERLSGKQGASYAVTAKHTHYPVGDYTLHVRPSWAFDVRLASERTGRIEWGNNENIKTYYASDGCTNIVRRGDEYRDIFPVWDWAGVPGITCPRPDEIPLPPKAWCVYGDSRFSGGVSDGLYGVTAYICESGYTGVAARKSWFFFDDEVVCLGSGIAASGQAAGLEVNTAVNQCLLNGGVTVLADGAALDLPLGTATRYAEAPDAVLHDEVAYFFPQGGDVSVSAKTQTGSWREINASQSDAPVSADVFALSINHGKNVRGGKYAYIVAPGIATAEDAKRYREQFPARVLANTEDVQAVYHQKLDILAMAFYRPGDYTGDGFSVRVDAPCTLLFRNAGAEQPTVYAADPAQTLARLTIQARLPASSGEREITVDFSGGLAGESKVGKWDTK